MEKLWTTSDIPPQFLNNLGLVGKVPHIALRSDPRISYALYIPPNKYNPDPSSPSNRQHDSVLPKLPLLVYIHGSRRETSPIETDLVPFAESTPCAILAPLFPVGLDVSLDIDSYKMLRSPTVQSDLALISMLDEITYRWPGIETGKVYMMGFSGGGQFAHRFLYLYPERLNAVSIGAPGRTTALDYHQRWPVGISDVNTVFGKAVKTELIAKVAIQLIIGSEDNAIHGGKEFWDWLDEHRGKKTKEGAGVCEEGERPGDLPAMERGRLENLRLLQAAWKEHGIESEFEVVNGVSHSSKGVREAVLKYLQPLMRCTDAPMQ